MPHRLPNSKGSALIGVVLAILIFSILAAAIVPMISSSQQQIAAGHLAEKAFLLAESAFRYAASKYMHAGAAESQKNDALEELDGNYTLSDGQSRFRLTIYSYFFEIIAATGPQQYKAHCPGSFPDDMAFGSNLKLKIGDNIYTITGTTPIPLEQDDNITITLDQPFQLDTDRDRNIAYPATDAPTAASRSVNGTLEYDLNFTTPSDAAMFPLRNGRIRADNTVLTYQFNDRANHKLLDVRDPQNPAAVITSPTLPVTLIPQVRVEATGIYGAGALQARRQVVYHTPLRTGTTTREFTDRFDTKNDWTDTTGTTTTISAASGNSALKVDAALLSGSDTASLTIFTPATPAAKRVDFNSARRGTRGYLSYDTQLKIGFDTVPIPDYYLAGLSFRLSHADTGFFSSNGYGISLLRGDNGQADGISAGLFPDVINNQRAIILWQQTGDGTQRRWLAYKIMQDSSFHEDNEIMGSNQFHLQPVISSGWDIESNPAKQRPDSGSQSNWYYGNEFQGYTYQYSGASNAGGLESDPIDLPLGYDHMTLAFWSWHETEPGRYSTHDLKQVIITGSPNLTHTINVDGPFRGAAPGNWYREEIDLSAYAGQTIRIRFNFDTVDSLNNNYEGWYVDDIRIISDWPVQNSTVGVRLQEALVVRFESGHPEIKAGSRLYGQTSTSRATVMAPPLLIQGDWSVGNEARGVLLLNRPSVNDGMPAFIPGETLTVIGGPAGAAQVAASYNDDTDRKANIIQAFYASATQVGTGGNSDPLDHNTNAYRRLGPDDHLAWPPEVDGDGNWTDGDGNWTATDDYFRLIQWDDINDANVTDLTPISFLTRDQGLVANALIQSHQAELQSPAFPDILSEAEIGLHALGAGATDVYFDDFGIRIDAEKSDAIPPPLQQ